VKAVVKGVPTVYSACEEFVTKKHNKNPIHATSNFVPRLRTNDRPTPSSLIHASRRWQCIAIDVRLSVDTGRCNWSYSHRVWQWR